MYFFFFLCFIHIHTYAEIKLRKINYHVSVLNGIMRLRYLLWVS